MTFFIETFGCQMNKSDSELITLQMKSAGYTEVDDQNDAEIVIFNTCSIRKNAEERALSRLTQAVNKKENRPIVIAAGCLPQHKGLELLKNGVCDLAVGTYQSPDLPTFD
jgi:tRNA-2-methylthio-N6-dimethylallyladenosine synthase